MADFDVSAGCIELDIDATLDGLVIIFPGDAELQIPSPPGVDVAFAIDYAKQLLAAINSALMPLQPIFNIIDIIITIVEFAKAIPDSITGLDPSKLFKLIPKLLAKLDKLLSLIPPLSIPILIKTIINAIVVMLSGVKATLTAIVNVSIKVKLATDRADALTGPAKLQLQAAISCASASAAISMSGLAQGMKPLDSLLKIVKLFIEIVGLPIKIPTISDIGVDASFAVDLIGDLIDVLTLVVKAIVI